MNEIEIGTLWTLAPTPGDPFPSKPIIVEILDIKAGWVKYAQRPGLYDQKLPISKFLELYRPTEDNRQEEKEAGWFKRLMHGLPKKTVA